jgi:trimethylamine:corrinoid methyltransferase-like protein
MLRVNENQIVSRDCVDAMLASAMRLIQKIGIETNRKDLLEKAQGLRGLAVRGDRITVAPEVAYEIIEQNQVDKVPPATRPKNPVITVSEYASLFVDHHQRILRPLTRSDAIAGTKLMDSLTPRWLVGRSCGVPQDVVAPMQPIEQYLIGFRYSRNGGSTKVPIAPEVAPFMFEMREIAEDFDRKRRHFSVWVPSPLKLQGNELDELLDSGAQVLSFYVGSMPLMGMTGPVDPVGAYTLSLAETLGGAAVLHRLFPEAKVSIWPHPQAMDPRSGLMAFGTLEWNRLDILKKEILEHLGMPSKPKENLTSACMPDAQAQADKMASIAFGVTHGFTRFNLFPLCVDEAWSHVQLALDVEYVHTAWETQKLTSGIQRAKDAFNTLATAVRESQILGEMEDTVLNLRENYYPSPLPRLFSSSQWKTSGGLNPLADAEAYARELIEEADYAPPEGKLREVLGVYQRACREFGAEPMRLD